MEITNTLFFFLVFPVSLFLILFTKYMDSAVILFTTPTTPKEQAPAPPKNTKYFALSDYDWNVNVFFKGLIK
jgi:hypothetical protein